MLDLPPMQTRQKVEQVKACFNAVKNPHNPPYEAVKDTKGCRPGRGKSWMGQAEDSVLQLCQLTELKQTKEWDRYPNRFRCLYETHLPKNLAKALSRMASRQNSQRSSFSSKKTANCKTSQCTLMAQPPKTSQDGVPLSSKVRPPSRRQCSIYGFNLQLDNGGGAVTHAIRWIVSGGDSQTTHAIILTSSQ